MLRAEKLLEVIGPVAEQEFEQDHPDTTVETITIEPEWENTLMFSLTALRDHDFQRGANEPIVSVIEMVRNLALNDPEALVRVHRRFDKEDADNGPSDPE